MTLVRSALIGFITSGALVAAALPAGASPAVPAGHKPFAARGSSPRVEAAPGTVGGLRARQLLGSAPSGKVRLTVRLREGAPLAGAASAAAASGAKVRHLLPQLGLLSVELPATSAAAATARLQARSDVAGVTAVSVRHLSYTPNDTDFSQQASYLDAVHAPAAWDTAKGDPSVKVAVVDSGVDIGHPELASKVVGSYNAVAGADPTDVSDQVGHGTFVAGVAAAASDNRQGVTGVGFSSSILAVKVADSAGIIYTDDESAGVVWAADHGARVINLSLGSDTNDLGEADAIAYAQSQGVVVVAAAGNAASTAPSYPAAYPGVLAVGSTDAAGHRSSFSNYGSWVSVAAPGEGIFSTTPTAGSQLFANAGYDYGAGTSFSTPIVAGEVALLAAQVPSASAAVLRKAVVDSASGYAGLGLGTGQVDLAAALTHLPPSTTPTVTAPASASLVSGVADLTASTSGASVQFSIDGAAIGARVAASGGVAHLSWETWGLPDGAHALAAADCNAAGCGGVSPAVSATVQNPAPVITSPAASASVSQVVPVTVDVTDAAPKVRLSVDGTQVGALAAVSSGHAALSWPSGGFANGTHTIAVAACTTAGACGSSSSVDVIVDNTPPAVAAPAAGAQVSGRATLTGTGPGEGMLFVLDGTTVGFDGSAPFALPVDFSARPDGAHTLTVQACGATQGACNGLTSQTRSFTSKSLHPKLVGVSPSVFSPNGDTRAETTTIVFSLPDTEAVAWSVRDATGTTVRGPKGLGSLSAGTRKVVWNGLSNAGKRVPDGTYAVVLSTSRGTGAAALRGTASRPVRVDVAPPRLSTLTPGPSGFYPYPDGYHDTITPRVSVNEPGQLALTVRSSSGAVVRSVTVSHATTGAQSVAWNGRTTSGALAAAGSYTYSFTAVDHAQNRSSSGVMKVSVSAKRLVGKPASRTVTPAATRTALLVGSCSAVAADADWSGGYDFLSEYYCYDPSDSTSDVAASDHQLTFPAAIKYAHISLAVTSQRELPGYDSDTGLAFYRDTADNLAGTVTTLGASYGTRSLPAASPALLAGGRTLRWTVGAVGGSYYAVRSFTVGYTYYVLA